jgi:TonB family protein
MLDTSSSQRPFEKKRSGYGGTAYEAIQAAVAQEQENRRRLRWALAVALLAHLALFFIAFPEIQRQPLKVGSRQQQVYVIQPVRFQPPPPQVQQPIPKRKAKKIPIPDPTPDEPEPIREVDKLEVESDLELTDGIEVPFDIPPGPPAVGPYGPGEVMQVAGNVLAPEKIYAPTPTYSEEAREARIQGVVILQAIIDEEGTVAELKVIKGLPFQLTENTLETVKNWRFRPATLEGQPVPVYYNLTVSFSLQ